MFNLNTCLALFLLVTAVTSRKMRKGTMDTNQLRKDRMESKPGTMDAKQRRTEPINLGTAGNFAILTKAGVTNVATSAITGDVGVSPIDFGALTGFSLTLAGNGAYSTSTQVVGRLYAADYADPTPNNLRVAVADMEIAYQDAQSRPNTDAGRINLKSGLIGGETMTPGVYTFGSDITIHSDVTLDGGSKDVFIIQSSGALTMAAGTSIVLTGGAKASNIVWAVAGNVALGEGAVMQGTILCQTDVALVTGAVLNGRVLAQTECTLQKNVITKK